MIERRMYEFKTHNFGIVTWALATVAYADEQLFMGLARTAE